MLAIRASPPTMSAPAARASSACAPSAKTQTRIFFPVPWGRLATPRTIMSLRRGSMPSTTEMSTVSGNFAFALALTQGLTLVHL
jgi:hypothetical protein